MATRPDEPGTPSAAPDAVGLVELVRDLAEELNPGRTRRHAVSLDSSLDRDLALDSLSRVELLARVERTYGVSLAPALLAQAETPRDLLRALGAAAPRSRGDEFAAVSGPQAGGESAPPSTRTMLEALAWHVRVHPRRAHVHLYESGQLIRTIDYGELLEGGLGVAAGLAARGFEPGRSVAIMLPTCEAYLTSFLGIQLAGGIPVPIYPPARIHQIEDHFRRHARILENARVSHLITFEAVRRAATLLAGQVEGLDAVLTPEALGGAGGRPELPAPSETDIAFLQYTSGSTGSPKGVVLTHGNVLSSLRSMGAALRASPQDVFVSWLPLYHDMGLIGAWLGALYVGFPLVLMSPLDFLARPERWLRAIDAHGGTLSGGPNFAFDLCLRRIRDADIEGLDLSTWRVAFNGAEPVSPRTLERFQARFAAYGLASGALAPVYGLAEATLGVAFTPLGRAPRCDVVQREPMTRDGRAEPAVPDGRAEPAVPDGRAEPAVPDGRAEPAVGDGRAEPAVGDGRAEPAVGNGRAEPAVGNGRAEPAGAGNGDTVSFVSSGLPIPGFEVRIVDGAGRELPERVEGSVHFAGPSTTSGYFRNPEASRALFHGRWLDSGDRGYVAEGELYITGRTKDVIIRAGRNVYPYEIEQAVGELDGVRRGCVAAFGARVGDGDGECLVVVAETREREPEARRAMAEAIRATVGTLVDVAPDDVILAPPHTVLKTSSGKIRRTAVRELYEAGRLAVTTRAVWLQVTRLAFATLVPRLRRGRRAAASLGYAAWVYAVLAPAALVAWCAVALARRPATAWRRLGVLARAVLRLTAVRLEVVGAPRLPRAGPVVLVANHSSYVDGLVLVAAIERPIAFVAKGELARHALTRIFLARLGCRFVERFDAERGAADAGALDEIPASGRILGVFPEGTFHRMPGLLAFHMGAFACAARTGATLAPVVIRGTRSVLRGNELFPRRGRVRVEVLEPLEPLEPLGQRARDAQDEWSRAVQLRDAARAAILGRCAEPDLADRRPLLDHPAAPGAGQADDPA
jgi:1-acyl-sn-glycerol-3-phosphate acyltransferase